MGIFDFLTGKKPATANLAKIEEVAKSKPKQKTPYTMRVRFR